MYSKKIIPSPRRKEDGVAIIIVLSFVVLLTGLVVAFLARSLSEQQVSAASVGQVKGDMLAQSALNIIVGDLRQEIVLGSTTVAVSSGTGSVFIPSSGTTMLPKRDSNLVSGTIHNLVRVSSTAALDSPAVSTRASSASTITPSANLRSVSPKRWNSHYLIPLESGTTTSSFTPPQWVYMTGTGPAVVTTGTDTLGKSVIGRYAFAIYDEGGLLDINVVGHPSSGASTYAPLKSGLAYADVTQLSSTSPLTSSKIDNLVGWRNRASAVASGTFGGSYTFNSGSNYFQYLTTATNGLMTSVTISGTSDQSFTSRQALIRYWTNPLIGLPVDTLQYFGTHSRDWNFASYSPNLSRTKTSGIIKNDANGQDDTINPSFAKFLVSGTFERLDGSIAAIGEPLVKRFPLDRIVALKSGSETSVNLPMALQQGADSNTFSYVDREGASNAIKTLDQVASRNREPNFFELLKATITAGGVTRAATGTGSASESYANTIDKRIDYAIIQIGANILDQYDEDSFPTAISFDGRTFSGVEDLPYLYRVRQAIIKTEVPDPLPPSDGAAVSGTNLTKSGVAVAVLQPEVWNPHVSLSNTVSRPASFAFIVDQNNVGTSGTPTTIDFIAYSGADESSEGDTTTKGFTDPGLGYLLNQTQVEFADNSGAMFREPALVDEFSSSAGSLAKVVVVSGTDRTDWSLPASATVSGSYMGVYVGAAPLRWVSGTTQVISAKKLKTLATTGDQGVTYQLAYRNAAGAFVVYDKKIAPVAGEQEIDFSNTSLDKKGLLEGIQIWSFASDPRTGRFGMAGGYQPTAFAPAEGATTGTSGGSANGLPSLDGWTVGSPFNADLLGINETASATRYQDADGKVRRAMGSTGISPLAAGSANRPIILNRPFRSVADLGHVFSGLPWRNLDFSFPESAFAGLLDVFSLTETKSENGLVAGKVNLNTRQTEVLKAILAGAFLDDVTLSGTISVIQSGNLASAIRARTSGTGQLKSLREIAGDFNGTNYDGLAPIIATNLGADADVARKRESAVRALANAGQARVWNLFIDIIAQPGRFGNNSDITKFMVEGEQRYWVHLAIDRYTGQILDRTIEIVKE